MYSAGLLILSSLGTSWQLQADLTTEQPLLRGGDAGSDRGADWCQPLLPGRLGPAESSGVLPSILGAESREGSGVSSLTPFLLLSPLRNAGYLRSPVRARSPSPSLRVGGGTNLLRASRRRGSARLRTVHRRALSEAPLEGRGGGQGECGGRSCARRLG